MCECTEASVKYKKNRSDSVSIDRGLKQASAQVLEFSIVIENQ